MRFNISMDDFLAMKVHQSIRKLIMFRIFAYYTIKKYCTLQRCIFLSEYYMLHIRTCRNAALVPSESDGCPYSMTGNDFLSCRALETFNASVYN